MTARKTVRSKRRSRRAPLTRERVLRAAVGLADREGIQSLTMRKLAATLGIEAMSLYNHVRNKDDILDNLVDFVFGQIELPDAGTPWRQAMRQRAISAHEALLKYPWALGLMESRRQPGSANLRHHDAVLGSLRNAGFSVEMAGHAYSVLDAYIYGFTLTELTLPFQDSTGAAEVAQEIFTAFPLAEFPHLAEMATERAMKPGYHYGVEFEFGLDLILDGVEGIAKRGSS